MVVQKDMEQWFLKITDYADRLTYDLDKVDWPEETKKRQRDWIGRSNGARVRFKVVSEDGDVNELEVFTTAHDTIYGATFMVIAPDHPILNKLADQIENIDDVNKYISDATRKSELERQTQKEKTGVRIAGLVAINPLTNKEIPIFVADYVLYTYGTGAIMAVPGHDDRDNEFAKKYGLDVIT
jgi:leucyl-tRNA synthetase